MRKVFASRLVVKKEKRKKQKTIVHFRLPFQRVHTLVIFEGAIFKNH
jgi:hypothetical protein